MFMLGFFSKKANSNATLVATVGGFASSLFFNFILSVINFSFLSPTGFAKANDEGVYDIPFLYRMRFVFTICVIVMLCP